MPRAYDFDIQMDPVAKGRPRVTRSGHAFTPQKTRDAEAVIVSFAKANNITPLDGPLNVEVDLFFKQPKSNKTKHHIQRPDADNLCKLVTDALNGFAYHDDAQIVSLSITKQWSDHGHIHVFVGSIHD